MAKYTVKSNVDLVMQQLSANAASTMNRCGEIAVEAIQNQMLYGYGTPHGPDGHTEIVDTGRLFDSIQATVTRVSQNLVTAEAGTNVEYAGYVHNGTYKLEPRPFVRDALLSEETQDKLKTAITEGVSQGF